MQARRLRSQGSTSAQRRLKFAKAGAIALKIAAVAGAARSVTVPAWPPAIAARVLWRFAALPVLIFVLLKSRVLARRLTANAAGAIAQEPASLGARVRYLRSS